MTTTIDTTRPGLLPRGYRALAAYEAAIEPTRKAFEAADRRALWAYEKVKVEEELNCRHAPDGNWDHYHARFADVRLVDAWKVRLAARDGAREVLLTARYAAWEVLLAALAAEKEMG